MYERFTDRARKAMQLANQESQRFNHEYIGTEHVLLGLVKEGGGVAANVLHNFNIDLRKIRVEIEKVVIPGPAGEHLVMGRLPHTPRTKRVIEYSIEEARNLNQNYVGTEHLLLGLIREEEGVASQILTFLGLNLNALREEVLRLLGKGPQMAVPIELPSPDPTGVPSMPPVPAPGLTPLIDPRLSQPDVFALIQAERTYQDAKWGGIAEHPHPVGEWLLIMQGKLEEAVAFWRKGLSNDVAALHKVISLAAVAAACLEQHGGPLALQAMHDMEFMKTNWQYATPGKKSEAYWPVLEAMRERMKEVAKKREEEAAAKAETEFNGI